MDDDEDAHDGHDAFGPSSFQDLVELLEELDHSSPREPLAGMAFTVSPAQYLTILQMDLPCDVGPSDYSCNILYYKSRTSFIHRSLAFFFARVLHDQIMNLSMKTLLRNSFWGAPFPFPSKFETTTVPQLST